MTSDEPSVAGETLSNGPDGGWTARIEPRPWLETATRVCGTVAVVFATLACIPMLGVLSGYEFLALVLPAFPTVITGALAPPKSAAGS